MQVVCFYKTCRVVWTYSVLPLFVTPQRSLLLLCAATSTPLPTSRCNLTQERN